VVVTSRVPVTGGGIVGSLGSLGGVRTSAPGSGSVGVLELDENFTGPHATKVNKANPETMAKNSLDIFITVYLHTDLIVQFSNNFNVINYLEQMKVEVGYF